MQERSHLAHSLRSSLEHERCEVDARQLDAGQQTRESFQGVAGPATNFEERFGLKPVCSPGNFAMDAGFAGVVVEARDDPFVVVECGFAEVPGRVEMPALPGPLRDAGPGVKVGRARLAFEEGRAPPLRNWGI